MHVLTGPTDKQLRTADTRAKFEHTRATVPGTPTLSWEKVQEVHETQYLLRRTAGISPVTQEFRDGYDNVEWD